MRKQVKYNYGVKLNVVCINTTMQYGYMISIVAISIQHSYCYQLCFAVKVK